MSNLRDYFASRAMQALLTGHSAVSEEDAQRIAEQSYRVAKAMIDQSHGLPQRFKCTSCRDGDRPHHMNREGILVPVACSKCGLEPDHA